MQQRPGGGRRHVAFGRGVPPIIVLLTAACAHEEAAVGPEVASFKIEGNKAISDGDIKERIVTEATGWWPFADRKHFDSVTWDKDRDRVKRLYESRGYYHVDVTASSVPAEVARDPKAEVKLSMRVQEGPRAHVGKLELEGTGDLDPDERKAVTKRLPLKEGAPFTEDRWEQTKDVVEGRLKSAGHAEARVSGRAAVDLATDKVNTTVWMRPGPKYTFGDIVIEQGAPPHIEEQWIREQVQLEAPNGKVFSPEAVAEAQKRVFAMNVFSRADVAIGEADPETHQVPLVVQTQTAPYHLLRLGGGAGFDQVRNEVRLLGEWTDNNFRGGLRTLRLRARAGYAFIPDALTNFRGVDPISRRGPIGLLRADFLQPRLFGLPAWKLGAFVEGERQLQEAFTSTSGRAGPELIWQALADLRLSLGYTSEVSRIEKLGAINVLQNEEVIGCLSGQCNIWLSYLRQRATLDRRDEPLAPTRGYYFDLEVNQAGGPLGGKFSYWKALADVRGYVTFGRFTLGGRAQAGSLIPTSGNPSDTPIQQRLYGGGAMSMRGFGYRRLSPLLAVDPEQKEGDPPPKPEDLVTVVVGGNGLVVTNLEVRYKTTPSLLLAAFYDLGLVSRMPLHEAAYAQVFHALGGGIRYVTPVGALRLDIARRFPAGRREVGPPEYAMALAENTSCFGFGGSSGPMLSDGLCQIHLSIGEAF